MSTTDETIREAVAQQGTLWPLSALELAEKTGYSLATVYSSLRALRAVRVRRGRNQFGYSLPEDTPADFTSVEENLGIIDGKPWAIVAKTTMHVVRDAAMTKGITAEEYADGFKALGNRFLELAAHAEAVRDDPAWKIKLGITADTEKG